MKKKITTTQLKQMISEGVQKLHRLETLKEEKRRVEEQISMLEMVEPNEIVIEKIKGLVGNLKDKFGDYEVEATSGSGEDDYHFGMNITNFLEKDKGYYSIVRIKVYANKDGEFYLAEPFIYVHMDDKDFKIKLPESGGFTAAVQNGLFLDSTNYERAIKEEIWEISGQFGGQAPEIDSHHDIPNEY